MEFKISEMETGWATEFCVMSVSSPMTTEQMDEFIAEVEYAVGDDNWIRACRPGEDYWGENTPSPDLCLWFWAAPNDIDRVLEVVERYEQKHEAGSCAQ